MNSVIISDYIYLYTKYFSYINNITLWVIQIQNVYCW